MTDPTEDEYDGGLGEILAAQEALLDQHRGHCVAAAVQAAINHGIDDPTAFREVAAQFLESGEAGCICDTEPAPVDIPHDQCVSTKRDLRAEDEGVHRDQIVITPTAVAPYGDPEIWDCEHGFVYRIRR